MAQPTPTRLFLSYARGDDEPFVRRLYGDLRARGFVVWFDRVDLPSRRLTFHQEIKDAILNATDRVVHVAGPQAAVSEYVQEEWQFALYRPTARHMMATAIRKRGDAPLAIELREMVPLRDAG